MKNKKKFEAEACEFKNETECEEDIEEDMSDVKKEEEDFFGGEE
jgi:hypothetical protein